MSVASKRGNCLDVDCAGSTNNPFVDYAAEDMFASVAVGSDGTAYVVYDNGNAQDGPQGIGLATCSGGGCSTSTLVGGISVFDQTTATTAIGSDGNPVVAYSDAQFSGDGYYTYLSSTGHYYANGTDTVVTSGASVPDLAFGPDGFARIYVQNQAFWDSSPAGAVLVKCNNASCSSAAVNSISVPGASSVSYGSIALTADGFPRVEVDTGNNGSSYYIKCTAADCSTYDSTLISGDSAGVASMVADQNGTPVMIAQGLGSGVVYQVKGQVPTSLSGPTFNPPDAIVYTGQPKKDCNGDIDPDFPTSFYGYQRCAYYQLLDQKGQNMAAEIAIPEQVTVQDTNIGLRSHTANAGTNSSGLLGDDLALGSATRAPAPGNYALDLQTFTTTLKGGKKVTLRINCLDYEATDVKVTDVTSQGPDTTCTKQ